MHDLLHPITMIAIYLTIWWTVLFAVLPLGNRTYAELGIQVKDGGDPGAPVNPNLVKKAITTTWVAAVAFAVLYALLFSGIIPVPDLSQFGKTIKG
jgi:predicted secreted protein